MHIKNILQYLEETVKKCPDRVAFSDGKESLSFEDAYDKALSVGSFICDGGYSREAVVILMEKSPQTVASFLGVIYSGCFYVCIDTDAPMYRIKSIIGKVGARVAIYDRQNAQKAVLLPDGVEKILYDDIENYPHNCEKLSSVRNRQVDVDPVYVIFTSGSTGEPKGVCTSHRSVIDYTEALCKNLGFDGSCIFGNQAPLYLDSPIKEIMPALRCGASVYLIPKALFSQPAKLCDFLNRHKVNTICWVSSALVILSKLGALESNPPRFLRKICFGGEVMPLSQYEKWIRAYPDADFYNLYGPTEATGMSSFWRADRTLYDGEKIPIGRAFDNTEIFLFNGEIYIRGTCLCLGYIGGDNSAFVQNPTHNNYPDIVFKTGDYAEINSHGELVFICRADGMIKHNGYRVEIGEIENTALQCEDVILCACVFVGGNIYMFYTGDINNEDLIGFLSERLQKYMLPHKAFRLEQMPKTQSGKINRNELKKMLEDKTWKSL